MVQTASPIHCHPRDNKSDRRLKSSPAKSKPAQNSQFCPTLFTVLVLPSPLALDVCQEERALQAIKAQVRVPYGSSCLCSASKQKKVPTKDMLKVSFSSTVDFVPENSWESLKLGFGNLKPMGNNQEAPNTSVLISNLNYLGGNTLSFHLF